MTDPENKDQKNQDETVEQPAAAAEESGGTELTDEELGDAAGATIVVGAPKFKGASGGPARVLALV